jgi:hypothetical protein
VLVTRLCVVVDCAELLPPVVDFSVAEEDAEEGAVAEEEWEVSDDCCGGLDGAVVVVVVVVVGDEDGGSDEDGGQDVDGDDGAEEDVDVVVEVGVGQFGAGGVVVVVVDDGGFDEPGLPPGLLPGLFGTGFCTLLPVSGSDGRALTFSLYSLAHLRTVWTYVVELL